MGGTIPGVVEMSGADNRKDFLLELRSEEIPARMQAGARAELEKLFRREMTAAGVAPGEITVWSTPRRLALIARDLPAATEAVSEEAKGPPEGAPDAAVEGFPGVIDAGTFIIEQVPGVPELGKPPSEHGRW